MWSFLGGIPFVMSENPPHILASIRLFAALSALAFSPRWVVNKEHRLELGQCLPLPVPVVLRGPDATYGSRWARATDVAVLVEIADSSYARDSEVKPRRYTSFGIPVYWILDLNRRLVEVRTLPSGKGKHAGFGRCGVYQESDHVPVTLDGHSVGSMAAAGLFALSLSRLSLIVCRRAKTTYCGGAGGTP